MSNAVAARAAAGWEFTAEAAEEDGEMRGLCLGRLDVRIAGTVEIQGCIEVDEAPVGLRQRFPIQIEGKRLG